MKKLILSMIVIGMFIVTAFYQNTIVLASKAEQKSFDGTVILGRPTNTSIMASITTKTENEIYLAYGKESESYIYKTDILISNDTVPAEFIMNKLSSNQKYYYVITQ